MNRRKQNISRWYILGLALVLAAGCMLLSVGTAFARYRMDSEEQIHFMPKTFAEVALGVMEEDGFNQYGTFGWREEQLTETVGGVSQVRKVYRLDFTMANYLEQEGYDDEDMLARVRLVGSLDAWKGSEFGTVVLMDGTLLEDGTPRQVTAAVAPIREDTRLYHTFGMGWEFRFLDQEGQELTWKLEGGTLSCVQVQIIMDASALNGTSLLQLQVLGERVE